MKTQHSPWVLHQLGLKSFSEAMVRLRKYHRLKNNLGWLLFRSNFVVSPLETFLQFARQINNTSLIYETHPFSY